jgi:membrane protease YdiL (CAAX protease family)
MPAPVNPVNVIQTAESRVSIPSMMLFLVAALIVRSFIDVRMNDAGFTPIVAKHLSAVVGFAALGLLLGPLQARIWPSVQQQFKRPSSWPTLILTSAGLGFVLWLWQMLALVAVAPLHWQVALQSAMATSPTYWLVCSNPKVLLLAIPVMAVATPIAEEIVHRGIILPGLLPAGNKTAMLLSATLFAVLHEPATIPYAFLFGVFLALQMIHCRNLWAPIITHAVTNLLVMVSATCLVGRWQPGAITWTALSPATLITILLLACPIAAWTLATGIKAGAEPAGSAPT